MDDAQQLILKGSIDFDLLREQKAWLRGQDTEAAEGLLELVYAIEHQAVAAGVITEESVAIAGNEGDDVEPAN